MRRPNRRSRIYTRRRFVARRLQIAEYVIESQTDEARNIFKETPSGPRGSNDPTYFWPEPASISRTSALTRAGDGLARESCDHKVDCAKLIAMHLVDVSHPFHIRPVSGEHASTEVVYLDLTHDLHVGHLAGKVYPADARAEREDSHLTSRHRFALPAPLVTSR
ncbi:MAG TPA: hypothetical protein VFU63_07140 [Ktedonobacterales bacterium]|nr:hypothetical protein [Ktedonobacterales bacterium]